ncbi:MAG: flagellar hook-length control protein FliK, partial [Pirellulaceae bacterium]
MNLQAADRIGRISLLDVLPAAGPVPEPPTDRRFDAALASPPAKRTSPATSPPAESATRKDTPRSDRDDKTAAEPASEADENPDHYPAVTTQSTSQSADEPAQEEDEADDDNELADALVTPLVLLAELPPAAPLEETESPAADEAIAGKQAALLPAAHAAAELSPPARPVDAAATQPEKGVEPADVALTGAAVSAELAATARSQATAAQPAETALPAEISELMEVPAAPDEVEPYALGGRNDSREKSEESSQPAEDRPSSDPLAETRADLSATMAGAASAGEPGTQDLVAAAAASAPAADAPPASSAQNNPATLPVQPQPLARLSPDLLTAAAGRPGRDEAAAPVDSARLLHRVARAFAAAQEVGGEIRLRLSPPELGSLRLEVRVQDGVMVARLETETSAARTALIENLPALRERLAEQGVRIERFDVDLMQRQPGGTPDRQPDQPAQPPAPTPA